VRRVAANMFRLIAGKKNPAIALVLGEVAVIIVDRAGFVFVHRLDCWSSWKTDSIRRYTKTEGAREWPGGMDQAKHRMRRRLARAGVSSGLSVTYVVLHGSFLNRPHILPPDEAHRGLCLCALCRGVPVELRLCVA